MSRTGLDAHQVDHLFLLVGENPLPNYVSARLLLRPQGTAHLVYSTGTTPVYKRLSEALTQAGIQSRPVELGSAEADGVVIQQKIRQCASTCEGQIGLNYTGGTKTMAVHAYQAILKAFPNRSDLCFSYLDSRNLQLCIDGKAPVRDISLLLSPPPTLEQILKLHNLSWDANNLPIQHSQVPGGAEALVKLALKPKPNGSEVAKELELKNWCDQNLKNASTGRAWKEETQLAQLPPYSLSGLSEEVIKIFQGHLSTSATELDLKQVQQACSDFTKLSHICHWLDGGWLEAYSLHQIQAIATQFNLHDGAMSIHITDPRRPDDPKRGDQFEFDVAFLRGYQLFAISCTTAIKHADCKQKLFEAQLRARQLGGDEARVALVSCYNKESDYLKREMSFLTNDSDNDPRIEIFGCRDLKPNRFREKLTNWIQRNIGT